MIILPFVDVWIYITHTHTKSNTHKITCLYYTVKSCVWTRITTSLANFSIKKSQTHIQ